MLLRDDVEHELEDLTASLFEEAHKMVRDANVKQASAEKGLVEANMKIDGLETEVSALKTLVLTSTPSQPNRHLHPQIDLKNKERKIPCGSSCNPLSRISLSADVKHRFGDQVSHFWLPAHFSGDYLYLVLLPTGSL